MRKLILLVIILAAPCVMAASDTEIVSAVKQRAENGFFPKDVKVVSVKEVNFFPDDRDTAYARFGNVCGKAEISKDESKATLVFIAPVVEKASQISIDVPTIYDLSKQGEIAEKDIQNRCK
ncbi:Uncharacterised protein [Salmonella enterica]|uniref:Uncharacterized protein n=1 Tax=Salmonella enterica TaxID=28901 RepID=A0A379Q8W6_SALER|nr:hypothetical protein [Salmonella enterica subsp. salamae serovar Springs]SUF38174.1 Uncharacterised protein [Salmonella enterica]HCM1983661.1 hypothetical protein [Salmonella enterica subsp. salamae serovar 40:a:z39]